MSTAIMSGLKITSISRGKASNTFYETYRPHIQAAPFFRISPATLSTSMKRKKFIAYLIDEWSILLAQMQSPPALGMAVEKMA